jgi:peptide/nickel transport system substrate-binding protein
LGEALARLETAADWKTAREALQRVHRIAADDVAVLPLWQLGEHLAYRSTVKGIPSRPVVLYQDVEAWQAEPYLPELPVVTP